MNFSPRLVHDYLIIQAQKYPEKTALICGKERWNYRCLDEMSDLLACRLQEIGVGRHDRAVVMLDNSAEAVIAIYGILKAGATFVPLNSSMKAKKLSYIFKNCDAKVLFTHIAKAQIVTDALEELNFEIKIIWIGSGSQIPSIRGAHSFAWENVFCSKRSTPSKPDRFYPLVRCIDYDLAALIYTSGSTGEPKGVMSSHQNIVAAAQSIIQYLGNTSDDIIINLLPLSFDYGLYQVIMAFIFGGTVILEKSFLYLHDILKRMSKEKVTGFPIVPTILAMLLKMQDLTKYDLSSLRYVTNTGAALPVEHIRKFRALLPQVQFISMYGLTECKRVAYLPFKEIDRRPGSVGKAIPNCEVFVLDENGREVDPGEEGELVIRGANVMRGYWHDPELTQKIFRPGHLPGEIMLYSGDIFKKDAEGYLYFIGRKDDLIKCKAERVSAREIENTLHEMPGIDEACVIGVPDEILGQAIKAFIVRTNGQVITENDVLKYCQENLETFAVPKYIRFVKSLPKNPHGKIDKRILKEF